MYQSVFLHRYRDSNEAIRVTCAYHIGQWITIDVSELLKDEYLKYIGWLCSEPSRDVRLEAVIALSHVVQVMYCTLIYYLISLPL